MSFTFKSTIQGNRRIPFVFSQNRDFTFFAHPLAEPYSPRHMNDSSSHLSGVYQSCKMLKSTIIASFGIFRKATSRKLPQFQVIGNTFTANTLSRTGLVRTRTHLKIYLPLTFHSSPFNILFPIHDSSSRNTTIHLSLKHRNVNHQDDVLMKLFLH